MTQPYLTIVRVAICIVLSWAPHISFSQSEYTPGTVKDEISSLITTLDKHLKNVTYKPGDNVLMEQANLFFKHYKENSNKLVTKLQILLDQKRAKRIEKVFNDLSASRITKNEAINEILSQDCSVSTIAQLHFILDQLFDEAKVRVINELEDADNYERPEVFLPIEVFLEEDFPAQLKSVIDFMQTIN